MTGAVRKRACALAVLAGLILAGDVASAQVELLPLDHPATRTLVRIYEYGAIPEFPREHLPISRGEALRFLEQAAATPDLPSLLRREASYYAVELAADRTDSSSSVFIPTGPDSRLIYSRPLESRPVAILTYHDSTVPARMTLEPVLDLEMRLDPEHGTHAVVGQGGIQFRGTVLDHLGFGARFTNGSIAGDSLLALRDPRLRHTGKLGVEGQGRDIDFTNAHLRVAFGPLAAELAREPVALGGGGDASLLVSSLLPSTYDYLRLTARFGKVSFTHLHGSLLAEPNGAPAGWDAQIPSKYLAAHLLSVGPFAGVRVSLGESVIYGRRPFELGYINPLIFLKSEEQYLRDRDNANMYGALSINPLNGIFVEGEFLLDDLKFSRIGDGYWSNKTAWRAGARAVAIPYAGVDIGLSYTRVEPYTFSHFDETHTNEYTHDGVVLSGGGLQPNSYMVLGELRAAPVPGLWITAEIGAGEHGANVVDANDSLIRNVGGDYRYTLRSGIDSPVVTFLDGVLERTTQFRLDAEYELLRNLYLRAIAQVTRTEASAATTTDRQLWFGIRIGAY